MAKCKLVHGGFYWVRPKRPGFPAPVVVELIYQPDMDDGPWYVFFAGNEEEFPLEYVTLIRRVPRPR